MSLRHVVQELRNLTYNEMMELAQRIAREIDARIRAADQETPGNVLAEIISKLNIVSPELTDLEKHEAKYIQEIFSRRRAITIKHDKGFSMTCESLPGGAVVGTDLRKMFNQLMDQLVTMHALSKMK